MKQRFKNFLLHLWYALFNKDYKVLKRSPLFDPAYYLKQNPDIADGAIDPLLHYVSKGYKEGRIVCALFDNRYYLQQLALQTAEDINPLVHYLTGGWGGGVQPNRLFDPLPYTNDHPEIDFSTIDPLTHYIQHQDNNSLLPYFDASFYVNTYGDVTGSGFTPLQHYLKIGMEEKRTPSLYFDIAWYLDNNPVVQEKGLDPFMHYFEFGIVQGKSPCPLFDPVYYRKTYEVHDSDDLFGHYMEHGVLADHRPCSWFDPLFYREKYIVHEEHDSSPLAHYLEKGVKAGLYPNRNVFDLPQKPLISILVPVYNVTPSFLNNCVRSVVYQSYPHWELCLADDCSSDEHVRPLLERWAGQDRRIKVTFLDRNLGIAGATNAAATLATGDYIGLLDNDDELAAECLFRLVGAIASEQADLYYSDEVLIGNDGSQFSEFRKPAYNENLLLSHNYVTHFVVAEKELYQKTGGLDPRMNGAQDYDLFLKLSEGAKKIVHIPYVLYRWRAHETSTSINHEEKHYADEAGRNALQQAMERRKISAVVKKTEWKFFYHVDRELPGKPKVSVISSSSAGDDYIMWLRALAEKTSYPYVEFVVAVRDGDTGTPDFAEIDLPDNVRVLHVEAGNSLVTLYNLAMEDATGEYAVFLNTGIDVLNESWIEEMLKQATISGTGLVTGRILPQGEEECISRVPDVENNSPLYYNRFLQECSRHLNGLECVQNVFALSCNFCMVQRDLFLECGGFDDKSFPLLFADSDLSMRMRAAGYEHLYTPHARARWQQTDMVQELDRVEVDMEKDLFQRRWHTELCAGDHYYNRGVLGHDAAQQSAFLHWYAGQNQNV